MKIAILRTDGSDVDYRQYNSQEIGLARGLVHHGHTVDIITAKGDTGSRPPVEVIESPSGNPITIIRTGYRRIPVLEYGVLTSLRKLLRQGQYDLVHVSEENNPAATMVAFNCRRLGIPYVIYHGMYVVPSGRARSWYDRLHGYLLAPAIRRNVRAFLAKTSGASAEERGHALGTEEAMHEVSEACAAGDNAQTAAPELGDKVDYHFIAFVLGSDGGIYELDGTKAVPVHHGAVPEGKTFLAGAAQVIREKYMAVDPALQMWNMMAFVKED